MFGAIVLEIEMVAKGISFSKVKGYLIHTHNNALLAIGIIIILIYCVFKIQTNKKAN